MVHKVHKTKSLRFASTSVVDNDDLSVRKAQHRVHTFSSSPYFSKASLRSASLVEELRPKIPTTLDSGAGSSSLSPLLPRSLLGEGLREYLRSREWLLEYFLSLEWLRRGSLFGDGERFGDRVVRRGETDLRGDLEGDLLLTGDLDEPLGLRLLIGKKNVVHV